MQIISSYIYIYTFIYVSLYIKINTHFNNKNRFILLMNSTKEISIDVFLLKTHYTYVLAFYKFQCGD